MNDAPETQAPSRGTIIVDSNVLIHGLGHPIAIALRAEPDEYEAYYTNMLTALAKRGFRIVIPESVALEAATLLKGGKNLNHYFRDKRGYDMDGIGYFLTNVAANKYPGISIRSSQDAPEPIGDYIRKFHDAVDSGLSRKEIAQCIRENYNSVDRKHLADREIVSLMQGEYAADVKEHRAFVLTNENRLIRDAGGLENAVTLRQLLYSMTGAGLQRSMGVVRGTPTAELENDMLYGQPPSPRHHAEDYRAHPFFARLTETPARAAGGGKLSQVGKLMRHYQTSRER